MKRVTDNEIIGDAVRLVNEGMRVTFPVKGNSMLPFIIGGRESVDLVKPQELKEGQIVLAWVENKCYVVHRIIRIDGNDVTLMGDGNIGGVEHCKRDDVAALALNFVTPDGTQHPLYAPWRVTAAGVWRRLLPVRRWLLAIYKRTFLRFKI